MQANSTTQQSLFLYLNSYIEPIDTVRNNLVHKALKKKITWCQLKGKMNCNAMKTFIKNCAKVKENEWEISWYKLPHLLGWKNALVSVGRGHKARHYMKRRKNIFNINAHIYKGFNKWIKFICTARKELHIWEKACSEKIYFEFLQEKVEMNSQHIVMVVKLAWMMQLCGWKWKQLDYIKRRCSSVFYCPNIKVKEKMKIHLGTIMDFSTLRPYRPFHFLDSFSHYFPFFLTYFPLVPSYFMYQRQRNKKKKTTCNGGKESEVKHAEESKKKIICVVGIIFKDKPKEISWKIFLMLFLTTMYKKGRKHVAV